MNRERTRAHVLLVEDEEWIRELWAEELSERQCFTVTAVGDAHAALPVLASGQLSAAIIDLGLPQLSGETLIGIARSIDPTLPIVAVTGFDAGCYQHLWDKGIRVLQKPFRTSWLLFNLETLLIPRPEVDTRAGSIAWLDAAG